MRLIRLVRASDLDSLVELTEFTTFGLTTLSRDPDRLAERIDRSESGSAPLLVMTDGAQGPLIGTAGLFPHVGDATRAEPFYAYRLERTVHHSETLQVHNEVDALHLVKLFDGPAELGTLFLHPNHRGGGTGRVLSLSRFMLVARHPENYDRQFIAEMRGVVDDSGHSPFWDGLGRHFFRVDFPIADLLSSNDKRFIAELMPTHPIYVPLLSPEAQAVIGKVHPHTEPALRLLESEGFHFAKMVDIFDAGPCVQCDRNAIRTLVHSTTSKVADVAHDQTSGPLDTLVATVDGPFRCVGCATTRREGDVVLQQDAAEALQVCIGDRVIVSPLRGTSKQFWKAS